MNFNEFQEQLAEKLNETGREITRQVLEEWIGKLKKKTERRGWQVWRSGTVKK